LLGQPSTAPDFSKPLALHLSKQSLLARLNRFLSTNLLDELSPNILPSHVTTHHRPSSSPRSFR
jgi:hypothetical protein